MPIQLNEEDGGKLLAVHVSGKLTAADYGHFVSDFERLVGLHGKLHVLFDMTGFHGWTAGALWEDTKFAVHHFSDIDRLAMVGEKKWQEGMATFCKPFTRAAIKYFDHAEHRDGASGHDPFAAAKTEHQPTSIMNKTLLIVADLGLLRAYSRTQNIADRQPHLELVSELKPESAHQKVSDQVTDQAGRFPRGGGGANIPGDLSTGESLSAEAEQNRRLISQLAGRINTLLADPEVTRCSVAISGAIHNQLLEAIDPKARAKIGQVLASNLAKTDPSELPAHFARAAS